MAINGILPLFYLFTVSLPSAAGDELSAELVFDLLSRRIDVVMVELKRDVKRIENRIEIIENNVCNKKTESKLSETTHTLIQQADCKNINEGIRPIFSEKLKRQTKAFYSMLKTEKAILREKVDHFQNLFHQLQTDITSRFALLNSSVGNSIENLEKIVNGHKAYTSISLQDMSLDIQEKMNEYETNLTQMSLDIKRDVANKLNEAGESITANAHSNSSMMKCDYSSKLSSEISKVTSKIYEIHRKECFISGSSEDYMFTKTTTKSGLGCQRWDKQTPHKHKYRDDQFSDGSKSEANNYCRDPGNDGFLWCYTMDSDNRWESCGIPRCDEPERNSNTHDCYSTSSRIKIGKVGDRTKKFVRVKIKYPSVMQMKSPAARTVMDVVRSKAILMVSAGVEISGECYKRCHNDYSQTCNLSGHKCAKTESKGFKCLPVHRIDECISNPCQNGGTCTDSLDGYTCTCQDSHVGTNCDVINHCADNPCKNGGICTNNVGSYTCTCCDGWSGATCQDNTYDCYTITDKDRESGSSDEEICESQNKTRVTYSSVNVPAGCENCDGCCQYKVCFSGACRDYTGTWHRTASGLQCQRWDSQVLHEHDYSTSNYYPKDDSIFDAHNYCRDPDFTNVLWCYTELQGTRWESCGIPDCSCP